MFRHLVVALDGSESSWRALDTALEFAGREGSAVDVVSVEEESPRYVATREESAVERSEADSYFAGLHQEAKRRAARRGVSVSTKILRGHEAQALIEYVCSDGYDLLVVGHRGHSGVWGAFLGSTADKLVGHAPCSVLVVRPRPGGGPLKRLLVGLDGSPLGQRALEAALEIARPWGASVHGLSVVEGEPPAATQGREQARSDYLTQVQVAAGEQALVAGVSFKADMRDGYAAGVLVSQAQREEIDLIVVGATGHERPWSPTAGGTARKVANEAPCGVLVVRPPVLARKVRDVMTRDVASVAETAPLAEAVELLVRRDIKAVPVVDGGQRVVGIITGGDLLSRGQLGLRLSVQRDLSQEEFAEQVRALESAGQTVRAVMTPNPLKVGPETAIDKAIHLMVSHSLKRLPVVNDQGRLVGILSRADVLRQLAALPELPAEPRGTIAARARTAGEAMDPEVPTVPSSAPVETVLRRVLGTPPRRVVVVDPEGKVVGIIADRDLLACADPGMRPGLLEVLAGRLAPQQVGEGVLRPSHAHGPLTAADVMTRNVFSVSTETPILDVLRIMVTRRVKRLVVLDAEGRPAGIIDRQALLRSLVD
jgi:nucleotide-binding universal stress UspA family protein/CBS-domain-containing membrane protein